MHIETEFTQDAIFGNDPEGSTGLDHKASIANFIDALEEQLKADFPAATVKVWFGITDRTTVDGLLDHEDIPLVEETFSAVAEDWGWGVVEEPDIPLWDEHCLHLSFTGEGWFFRFSEYEPRHGPCYTHGEAIEAAYDYLSDAETGAECLAGKSLRQYVLSKIQAAIDDGQYPADIVAMWGEYGYDEEISWPLYPGPRYDAETSATEAVEAARAACQDIARQYRIMVKALQACADFLGVVQAWQTEPDGSITCIYCGFTRDSDYAEGHEHDCPYQQAKLAIEEALGD